MDPTRFDTITKRFATRRTRRQALATGVSLAATGLLAKPRLTMAQDATPAATSALPANPHPSADAATTRPEYLFVQTFDTGTWTPNVGESGVYTLTLTGAAAQTTFFSDRPEREVGLAPNQAFIDGLGFATANPPNAALVVAPDGSDEQDVLLVELLSPVYNADSATLTYDAKVLADYGGRGLAPLAQQQTDYKLAESFGEGSLFIDDCPDSTNDGCYAGNPSGGFLYYVGNVTSGNCWNSSYTGDFGCSPCNSYAPTCDQVYASECGKTAVGCTDDIARCGSPGCM
jgi:hypothetical protein